MRLLSGMPLLALLAAGPAFLAPAVLAPAWAQGPPGPPAVGVVPVEVATITQTSEFVGRVQAIERVAVTARVTAFLEQRLFTEGADVRAGDVLYRLERGPFEAEVARQEAAVADISARLTNSTIQLNRAQSLLQTPAGQRSQVDDAVAAQRSLAAQFAAAQAQARVARINLDYVEIKAAISGQIGRSAITPGNVVSPSSGPLTTIVSQDPMYVTFPVAVRVLTELRTRYMGKGGLNAVRVRLTLPDGSAYDRNGKIDYVDPTVSAGTDTILTRAVIANPPLGTPAPGRPVERRLTDGAFVTVLVEGIQPVTAPGIPRAAVLSDQSGNFVYVVGPDNKVERRAVQLGQSTPAQAIIAGGLKVGETVVLEGLQRVRPGIQVAPGPVGPRPPGTPGAAPAAGTSPTPAAGTAAAPGTGTAGGAAPGSVPGGATAGGIVTGGTAAGGSATATTGTNGSTGAGPAGSGAAMTPPATAGRDASGTATPGTAATGAATPGTNPSGAGAAVTAMPGSGSSPGASPPGTGTPNAMTPDTGASAAGGPGTGAPGAAAPGGNGAAGTAPGGNGASGTGAAGAGAATGASAGTGGR